MLNSGFSCKLGTKLSHEIRNYVFIKGFRISIWIRLNLFMEPNSKNWWSTLPGVITAIAGTLTAITGLIIALDQIGFFKANPNRQQTSQQQQSSTNSTTTKSEVLKKENAGNGSSKEITIDKKPVHLRGPGGIKMRLDILRATLESYDHQNSLVSFRFRIFDESGFGLNIMDSDFVLLIDDIPTATNNESGVYVEPRAAAETTAAFEVPLNTKNAVLKIHFYDSSVTIPVSLNN